MNYNFQPMSVFNLRFHITKMAYCQSSLNKLNHTINRKMRYLRLYDCSFMSISYCNCVFRYYIPNSSQLFPLFSHYIPIKNNIKTITRGLKS